MVTIRLGVWARGAAASARNAIRQVFVDMDLKEGLRWKHVELMSTRPQGATDL